MKSRGVKQSMAILSLVLSLNSVPAHAQDLGTRFSQTWQQVKAKATDFWYYITDYHDPAQADATKPVGTETTAAKPNPTPGAPAAATAPTNTATPATAAPTGTAQMAPPSTAQPASKTVARPNETPEQAQLRSQPIYQQKADNSTLEDIKAVQQKVHSTPVLSVATPGVAGTSNLPKSKSGVPMADFRRYRATKSIPRLDIGTENQISAKDFTYGSLNWNLQSGSEFQRLPLVPSIYTHELSEALRIKATPVIGPKTLQANARPSGSPVTQATIDAIQYKLHVGEDSKPHAYRPFSEEELKMAAALILFSRGSHCHFVMGMFHQLAQAPKTKVEATYHLGACAHQLEMHQAAFDALSSVVAAGDKDYSVPALELLATNLPMIYEKDFYKLAKSVPNFKAMITDKFRDAITYRMAKGAYRMADYKTSIVYADQVAAASDLNSDARVLSAMNSFALGEKARALKKLEEVWKSLEARKEPNSNIRALTAINIARMYFSQNKYDKALDHYMQIPKDHPLWVQGLIEQGWTQLALEDYAGAIGNMYSLHSPYFKAVYQPESFVVRTIGYLNICQYGDAYKTLSWLEKDYRDWFNRTEGYLKTRTEPAMMYKTVKNYIQGKSTSDIEGVPYQVWRELAHRKDFLNLQTALNDKQDEARRYEGVNEKIKKEKAGIRTRADQAKRRFDELKNKIARVKVDKSLVREVPQWQASMNLERDLIIGLRFQLAILEQGRQGYLTFQNKCQDKLDTETAGLVNQAGGSLLAHAKHMREEMNRVLENNEFLRYEVFSGSGENIRYQVAGGEVSGANRVPAHIKPSKMMNWSFDGEFWEDEIGSYRSSLQNNCPTAAKSPYERQEGSQARMNEE